MLIKFKDSDPRAGTTARMDSHRGQQLIDSGAAEAVKEGGEAKAAAPAPAPAPAAESPAAPAAPAPTSAPAPATSKAPAKTTGKARK